MLTELMNQPSINKDFTNTGPSLKSAHLNQQVLEEKAYISISKHLLKLNTGFRYKPLDLNMKYWFKQPKKN